MLGSKWMRCLSAWKAGWIDGCLRPCHSDTAAAPGRAAWQIARWVDVVFVVLLVVVFGSLVTHSYSVICSGRVQCCWLVSLSGHFWRIGKIAIARTTKVVVKRIFYRSTLFQLWDLIEIPRVDIYSTNTKYFQEYFICYSVSIERGYWRCEQLLTVWRSDIGGHSNMVIKPRGN
jgi:hypothetical protein